MENWLINYAQEYEYDGITMGKHEYNTSVNFSSRVGDVVEEGLLFRGKYGGFYSDIFQFDKKNKTMVTRPESSYWLWRKQQRIGEVFEELQ